MSRNKNDDLIIAARNAATTSYSPYSHFKVGAAVFAGGKIYTGTNIENASFGLTICAERVAIFSAIKDGNRKIDALAVSCVDAGVSSPPEARVPCGACRQVLQEFADGEARIAIDGVGEFTQDQLLPMAFKLK
jgi:cytidine deaminase